MCGADARHGGGVVHHEALAGRHVLLRGQAGGIGAGAGHDSVGAASDVDEGRDPALDGRQMPLSGELAGPAAAAAGRGGGRRVPRPELEALRAAAPGAGEWSAIPRARRAADRAGEEPRRMAPVRVSRSRGGWCTRDWRRCWRTGCRGSGRSPSRCRPTTGASSCSRVPRRRWSRHSMGGLLSPENLRRRYQRVLNATEMARRQFREIARVTGLVFPGLSALGQDGAAAAGVERTLLRRVHALRPGQHAAGPGLPGSARAAAGAEPAGRGAQAAVGIARGGDGSARFTPLAFPLLVDRTRNKLSSESLADRVKRMQVALERAAG